MSLNQHHHRIFWMIILLSCNPEIKNNLHEGNYDSLTTRYGDSIVIKEQAEAERKRKKMEMEKQLDQDSADMETALGSALNVAALHIKDKRFAINFEYISGDSVMPILINIEIGSFFSDKRKYLIIHREGVSDIGIDIYLEGKTGFKKLLNYSRWKMEYLNDTIQDVNGDGFKDYIVNWYGSNGCCLKSFSDVMIFNRVNGSLYGPIIFINPTFSPEEKIVRGVKYGHAGYTSMYKYSWAGDHLDTLEHIYYEENNGVKSGKVIRESRVSPGSNKTNQELLNDVPVEYKKIYGYDWFTGNIN